jgi:hypothetical protein
MSAVSLALAIALSVAILPPRSGVPVVTVTVRLETLDGSGPPVLTPADFVVRVDGKVLPVTSVVANRGPAAVLLLVDVSASALWHAPRLNGAFHGYDLAGLVRGVDRALATGLADHARLRVAAFGGRTLSTTDQFTSGREEQQAAVQALLGPIAASSEPEGPNWPLSQVAPSPVWDAVAQGVRLLRDEPAPRAILLVTDGKATGNSLSLEDAARESALRDTAVYTLMEHLWIGSDHFERDREKVESFLRSLADRTGGMFGSDERLTEFSLREGLPPIRTMFEALHHTASLSFELDGDTPGPGLLQVLVHRAGLRVHAPAWVTSSSPPSPARP